jgi:hypothetical protein
MGLSDVDPFAILSGLVSVVIVGLLIWLCVLIYKWYKNPRLAPGFIQNMYYYFYPRSYDQATGMPLHLFGGNNKKWIEVKNSTLSNCMSNCNMTTGCNTFIHSENFKSCVYEKETDVSESTTLMQLGGELFGDITTYVSTAGPHPAYSYNVYSNVNYASQTSNILSISGDVFTCAKKCNETSNCAAFSTGLNLLDKTNCTLVSTIASNVTSSNTMSFVLEPTVFSPATFES